MLSLGAGGAAAITHRSPWHTSCWWLSCPGAGEASGAHSACWGLPGKSWACVRAGSLQGDLGLPQAGENEVRQPTRVNFHPMGPGRRIGDDFWGGSTSPGAQGRHQCPWWAGGAVFEPAHPYWHSWLMTDSAPAQLNISTPSPGPGAPQMWMDP